MLYIYIVIAIVSMYVIYHYSGYLNIIGKRKNKNKNIFLCIVIFLICTYFLVVLIDFSLYSVNVPLFCFYGIIIISALLKRMTDSKCLIKVIDKGKSYFSVGEEDFNNSFIDNKTSSDGLIDKNNKNSYSKDRYKIYKLLESEENIDPLKFEKNKELSKLRLYQLLFSLESDGLALKRITDSGIIFYKR